jgi:phenylalanyl-tRNA synthetase beta chain
MKISTQAIKFINEKYRSAGSPARSGVDELVKRIGAQLGAVEESVDFGSKYLGAVIVKVVERVAHPDSDHLSLCRIDDGGVVKDVERGDDKLVQVVCGAPNVHVGMLAIWLPPGMTVPETYNKEPLVLAARPIRGQVSNGMLASARELDLGDDHSGILEVDSDFAPGTPFDEAYHLKDDFIIDIENKMFTHRPDCFGWLGVAREIEGIHGRKYKSPRWYKANAALPKIEAKELKLEVRNELSKLVPRFCAVVMSGVKVGPSPIWLRADLARVGLRSINNIVDYTNFYMLKTGQPLHAYDYDKVVAQDGTGQATLVVRHPKKGEKILLLNGKEVQPRSDAIMIATEKSLLGIGGVMGGGDTEVDDHTTNIILEAATFDMYSIRRTSMEHGLFTDAVTRFTKGQSPLQNVAVMAKIVETIGQDASGKVASKLVDDNHLPKSVMERGSVYPPVRLTADFINSRLGSNFTKQEIAKLLTNVEFEVDVTGNDISVQAPFWRTDIEIPEDVVEEIGRLNGFDKLPHNLPTRATSAPKIDPMAALKSGIRALLAAAGANELQTYSFVHEKLMQNVGQAKVHAFKIRNAISPELQHYRLSLTPSLLEKVHPNIKAGFGSFALFEMNKVHIKGDLECDGLPREYQTLALSYASKTKTSGAPYYQAKHYLEYLLRSLHVPYVIKQADHLPQWEIGRQVYAPFEPSRTGFVYLGPENQFAGFVGEYNAAARKNLKLPETSAGFEIDLERMLQNRLSNTYSALPRFPAVEQDVCFKLPAETAYAQLIEVLQKALNEQSEIQASISPVDIYQAKDDTKHKNITVHLALQHTERTLETTEVNQLLTKVAGHVKTALKGVQV